AAAGADAIRSGIFRFNKRHEGRADFIVRDQIDVVTIKLWRQLELVAGTEIVAVTTDETAGWANADPSTGLRYQRSITLKYEIAGILVHRQAGRIVSAV